MDIFTRNLRFLKKSYPQLLSVIQEEQTDSYIHVVTKKQEPNLIININGSKFTLHSKYSAEDEACNWTRSIDKSEVQSEHLLLIGCGLGYFLEQLLESSNSPNIYVYEPNLVVFREWIKSRDITNILSNPKIRLFVVGEDELFQNILAHQISLHVTDSMSTISPPIYKKMYPNMLINTQTRIKDALYTCKANQVTLSTFNKEWFENILYNLPYIKQSTSVAKLKGVLKSKTVIIVGSGPSLKYDIESIKAVKSKCLIIAAGSSIQALEYHGIKPHLVVSIDGGLPNYRVFENVISKQVPMVFGSQINYRIVESYKAPLFSLLLDTDALTPNIMRDANIPVFKSSTSVTGTAIQLAAFMGATEIILTGQDLSYPRKQYYTTGVKHISKDNIDNELNDATELVTNVEGGRNPTTLKMKVTLNDMEQLIQLISFDHIRVINTSKKGARIAGTEWISMESLLPQWLDYEDQDYCFENLTIQVPHKDKEQELRALKNDILSINIEIKKISKRIKKLLVAITTMSEKIEKGNLNAISKILVDIDKLWTNITRADIFTVTYSFLLKPYIDNYMRHVPKIVETQNHKEKGVLIIKYLGELVEQMDKFTPELTSSLNNAINRLDLLNPRLGDVSDEWTI